MRASLQRRARRKDIIDQNNSAALQRIVGRFEGPRHLGSPIRSVGTHLVRGAANSSEASGQTFETCQRRHCFSQPLSLIIPTFAKTGGMKWHRKQTINLPRRLHQRPGHRLAQDSGHRAAGLVLEGVNGLARFAGVMSGGY